MSVDLEQARSSTHDKLVDKLDDLAQGKDIKSLESFAKAYLGIYLDLDKGLLPGERVRQLADETILGSIWSGFDAVLSSHSLPTPESIGSRYAADERLAEGYIALAALDRQVRHHHDDMSGIVIDDETLKSLICFHYVDRNELPNRWLIDVAQNRPALFADAMLRFWRSIQACGQERYPGFRDMLLKQSYAPVLQQLALPVLQTIRRIHKKLLPLLLLAAFRYVPHEALCSACRVHLADVKDPSVVHHLYWLATAYLLAPHDYEAQLFEYVGRTREKALPLLHYIEPVIKDNRQLGLEITADMLACLLYMIAPKFRPGRDQFGRLDDNVQKIVCLFKRLGQDSSQEARQAVQRLRRIRVMRLYSSYLDQAEQAQML